MSTAGLNERRQSSCKGSFGFLGKIAISVQRYERDKVPQSEYLKERNLDFEVEEKLQLKLI
jgi:hypothetical protein